MFRPKPARCQVTVVEDRGVELRRGDPFIVAISPRPGVPARRTHEIGTLLHRFHDQIGRDFSVYPRRLTVNVFASHRAFARALWAQQHQRPQSDLDDSGSIVRGSLLLGPLPETYLRHNLAHIYTEWLIDIITRNTSDVLPSDPWLYDGLAEYEAHRHAPGSLTCSGSPTPDAILDVTRIHTARRWLQIRAGPLGSLEYCLAYLQVRRLVTHVGWPCVLDALHDPRGWAGAAARLKKSDRAGICASNRT